MKKWGKWLLLSAAGAVLAGCAAEETAAETVTTVENQVEVPEIPTIDEGNKVETTIPIENSDQWVEDAVAETQAVNENEYVNLDRGVMTVEQIDGMLKSLPMELTFADENNQFLYYNYREEPDYMLAPRAPEQVGNSLSEGHPEAVKENVKRVVNLFHAKEESFFQRPVETDDEEEYIVISYQAIYGENGDYKGIVQYAQDIQPLVDFYLEQNGMMLIKDPDAVSGVSE